LKIGYFGLPLGAYLLISDGHELDPCVLSPLEAPGRRRVRAQIGGDRLLDARSLPNQAIIPQIEAALARARPELIVSWFWTRLLPEAWLRRARLGGIGVHPSLLPRHRGPNPYFWTIDAGDADAGVTLHVLAPEYDTGAILLQRAIPVGDRNSWQLARALDRPSLALLREGVRSLGKGRGPAEITQHEVDATWAPEPTGRELSVDWSWSTERVLRRIRALSPVPGLAVEVHDLRFFVTRARAAVTFVEALEPGEAALLGEAETLVIRTADGAIAVERAVLGLADDSEEHGAEVTLELSERALAAELGARRP
jgi:methionyl-tRNA formyltransferase